MEFSFVELESPHEVIRNLSLRDLTLALSALRDGEQRIRKGWVQHAAAKTHDNHLVPSDAPNAAKWCITGSLHLDTLPHGDDFEAADLARLYLEDALPRTCPTLSLAALREDTVESGDGPLPTWNDEYATFEDVLALFGAAIIRIQEDIHAASAERS